MYLCLDYIRALICSPCWEVEVSWGRTEYKLFFLYYLGIFSLSVPASPQASLMAEGLSWLYQLYYFQPNDHTLQQINCKHKADVIGINNYLVDAKRSNNQQPKSAKSNWHSQANWANSRACLFKHNFLFTWPLNNRSVTLRKMKTKKATMTAGGDVVIAQRLGLSA